MLVSRYLKDSEIQEIALEVSEAAADGRNNAVSTIFRTFFGPAQEAAAELYGVSLSGVQIIYIAKLAQIGYQSAIKKHRREHPMDNPRSGSFLGKGA